MDYEVREKAMSKAFMNAAKKAEDSKVLDVVAKPKQKKDMEYMLCEMAHTLLRESLDMFKDGDMTFAEAIEDFSKAALAIDEKDLKVTDKPSKEKDGEDKSGPSEILMED